jgi:hypothetical protein
MEWPEQRRESDVRMENDSGLKAGVSWLKEARLA